MMAEWAETQLILVAAAVAWAVTLVVLGVAVRKARQAVAATEAARADTARLRQELHALCSGAVGMGEQLRRLGAAVSVLSERHERLELRDPGERPYAQAIRLVHGGAGADEIAGTCGLTRSEAELIQLLHAVDRAS